MALDDWVVKGTEPPASRVPRRAEGTAAMVQARAGRQTGVVPQDKVGWPTIPSAT